MIDYIFFDRGGVLNVSTGKIIIKRIMEEFSLNEKTVRNTLDSQARDLERGIVTETEFWNNFLISLNLSSQYISNINLCEIYKTHTKKIDSTFKIVKKLKEKGYELGIITNTIRSIHEYNQSVDLYKEFNPIIASCEVGYIKPELEIYQFALERVQKDPKNCIFIDDREKFLEPASRLGMTTIHYTSSSGLERELNNLGVL